MVHISTLVVLLALSGVALSVRNLDARSLNGEFSKIIQLFIIQFFIWFPKEAESILQRWRFWGFAVVTRNRTCMYVCYFQIKVNHTLDKTKPESKACKRRIVLLTIQVARWLGSLLDFRLVKSWNSLSAWSVAATFPLSIEVVLVFDDNMEWWGCATNHNTAGQWDEQIVMNPKHDLMK